jgi:hypothetical protein
MLKMLHLDVAKTDWVFARRGRWLSVVTAAGAQPWINPRGFPHARHGVGAGARAGAGCGTRSVGREVDAGAAQVWEPCPDATSHLDV